MEIDRRKVEAPTETEKWKINSQREGREIKNIYINKEKVREKKYINMKKEKEDSSCGEKMIYEKKIRKEEKTM